VKVDANTSKDVSPINHHVLEITPQVSMILNNVLPVKDHHLFYMKKLELSKLDFLEVQDLEPQVLNIKSPSFKASLFAHPSFKGSCFGYLGFKGSRFGFQSSGCCPRFGGSS
jgi:hypothetical protein